MAAEEGARIAGRYRLLEHIGRGGMGTVWRAEDELLGRQVAVKQLHASPHLAADELATLHERTRREARSAARISHPNVVVVHDVVDDNARPCIVMEYVPSQTLGDVIKRDGGVPPREAIRIARGMVAALRAAHAAGVLHRDVKPGNVLLGADGRVVLTDFGIAQATGTSTLTRTGELVGSVDYVAPERVSGGTPGPASDLWSLGATLYQAVEGSPPFRRDTALETAYAIATEELRPLVRAGALTPLIEALLAKDPRQRPSAEDVERMLRVSAAEAETGASPRTDAVRPATASGEPQPPDRVPGGPVVRTTTPLAADGSVAQPKASPARARGRRAVVWALAAVVAVSLTAGAAVMALRDGDEGKPKASPSTDATTRSPSPSDKTTASPAAALPPVPDGYRLVDEEDELGVSFPVPDGWTRARPKGSEERNEIAYVSPNGLVGIRVSVLDFASSDPLQRWKNDEAKSLREGKLPGYHQLRMQRTTFRGLPAAIWEFAWRGRAREFRGYDLAFGRSGGNEYAIYLSAPRAQWREYKHVFDAVKNGFRMPENQDQQN